MAEQFIYYMSGVSKTYNNGKKILDDIHLSFYPDAKIGVLGANGSGKSTLLKIMAGMDKDYTGEAWAAKGSKIGYLPQEPELDPNLTVKENVMLGVKDKKAKLDRFNELASNYTDEIAEEFMQLQEDIDNMGLWDLDAKIDQAMQALRCPSPDKEVTVLSGGEKRRVALCKILLEDNDLLLLDEPTNHLDNETVGWLEKFLKEFKGAVLIVTHDRYFLDNVTGWILELDRGQGIPYKGNYSSWVEQKQKRYEQERQVEEGRLKALSREKEWINQNPKARQAKSKARIKAYDELVKIAENRKNTQAQIIIPHGERLGDKVIEVKGLTKGFDDKVLFENLDFKVEPGSIVGIIGPNGAGKSMLFKILCGLESPNSGEVVVGETVHMGYVDQNRDALKPDATVWQEISEGQDVIYLDKMSMNSRAYVSAFNFKGTDQQKKVGQLSGGERNRVHLAKLLKTGGNVILLDEPTNDLDVETLRALEEAIEDFAGSVLVISHDRWFLNRIATHIIAFEGNSEVVYFEGNYEEYEQDYKRRNNMSLIEPRAIKFKKFTR